MSLISSKSKRRVKIKALRIENIQYTRYAVLKFLILGGLNLSLKTGERLQMRKKFCAPAFCC